MKLQTVAVLGGNIAALLVALTLKRRVPQLAVQLIRTASEDPLSENESTTATVPKFLFEYLRLKPEQCYREAEPIWKLGTRFLWGARGEFYHTFAREYEHSPAEFPRGVGFYCTDGVRILGSASAFLAHHKAFVRRSDGLPQLTRSFGFHLEGTKFLAYLEKRCREEGVAFLDDALGKVERDGDKIGALNLKSGQQVTADLFIDATGSRSELLGQVLSEPFVSYERTLACDRVVTGGWARSDEMIEPYSTAETMDAGWCWQFEHEHWISRGYVYSSRSISDEAAAAEFLEKNPRIDIGTLRTERFQQGRYARNWVGNVIGVGCASGFVEPLQSTQLHMVCSQARLLADIISDSLLEPTPSLVELYNEAITQEWDDIRDFLSVHYVFNSRLDTPFWRMCRDKIALEKGAVRIVRYYQENGPTMLGASWLTRPESPFGLDGYLTVLVGLGTPHKKAYRPTATEQHTWKKRHALLEGQALRALNVEVCLKALRSAGWPACKH